eukprot:scaffold11964_cov90-Isochrysis_galbana.AAC.3
MAASDASNASNETKPKPRELPVSGSRIILGVETIVPKAEKVSYSSFSSTSGSRLPTKMFAPTSTVSLSLEAALTRMGLPWSLIMLSTLMAYSASGCPLNSTKPNPMCIWVSLSFGMCTLTTGPHCTHSSHSNASSTWLSRSPT